MRQTTIAMLLACALAAASLSQSPTQIVPVGILISNHTGANAQLLQTSTGAVSTVVSMPNTPMGLAFGFSGILHINLGDGIFGLSYSTRAQDTTAASVNPAMGQADVPKQQGKASNARIRTPEDMAKDRGLKSPGTGPQVIPFHPTITVDEYRKLKAKADASRGVSRTGGSSR